MKTTRTIGTLLKLLFPLLAIAALAPMAAAQTTITKSGAAASFAFNTPTAWVGGVVPGPGNVALWDSTPGSTSAVNLGANLSWQGIQITNPTALVEIGPTGGGGPYTLTLGSSGINASAATQSLYLYAPVTLISDQTWTFNGSAAQYFGTATTISSWDNGGHTLTLDNGSVNLWNSLSGAGGLIASGAGSLNIYGNCTYAGVTTVNKSVTIGSGTSGSIASTSTITSTNGSNLNISRSDAITLTNTITGNVSVNKFDVGTTTLAGASTYTGTTRVYNGVLSVSSIGSSTSGTSNMGGGNAFIGFGLNTTTGQLTYTGSGEITDRAINLGGTTGGAVIDQSGSGLLKFTAYNSASGAGNKTLTLQGSTSGAGEIAGVIVDNSGTNKTSLTKAGTGTWTLSAANLYTGATTVNGGILTFAKTSAKSSGTAVTAAAAGTIGLGVGGAGFYSSADVDSLFANTLTGFTMNAASGVAIDTSAGNFTYATNQSAARSLTKLGANSLTLTGANTYSGGTTVSAGTLILAHNSAAGTAGIVLSGDSSSTLQINSGVTIANNITFSNTNAGSSVTRLVANAAAYTVGTTGNLTSAFVGGQADTTASILAGTSTQVSTATLAMSFSDTSAAANDGVRKSDVFSLSGTSTDLFVLQLNVTGLDSSSFLGWLNGGSWVNAVSGNSGNNASGAQQGYLGSFSAFQGTYGSTLTTYVGAYGVDISGGSTWAVLNHNSDYAAIPEPATWALLAGAGTFFMVMRRRRRDEPRKP